MSFKPLTSIRSFRNSSSTSASSPTRGEENCSFSIRLDIVNEPLCCEAINRETQKDRVKPVF